MFKKELVELRKQIGKLVGKFAEVVTPEGKTLIYKGDTLVVFDAIYEFDDKGVMIPLEDGSYTLEDGSVVITMDGFVQSITKPASAEVAPVEVPMTEEVPAVELADVPVPVSGETAPAEAPVSGETAPVSGETLPMEADPMMVELVNGLMEKITELAGLINGVTTQVTEMEAKVNTIGKFTKVEPLKEKPEVNDKASAKLSYTDRILNAR